MFGIFDRHLGQNYLLIWLIFLFERCGFLTWAELDWSEEMTGPKAISARSKLLGCQASTGLKFAPHCCCLLCGERRGALLCVCSDLGFCEEWAEFGEFGETALKVLCILVFTIGLSKAGIFLAFMLVDVCTGY